MYPNHPELDYINDTDIENIIDDKIEEIDVLHIYPQVNVEHVYQ